MTPDVLEERAFALWPMPDSTPGSLVGPSYTPGAETVLDNVTHLVWQRTLPAIYDGCTGQSQDGAAPGTACYWEEAKKYCASPALASWLGGTGWRLPTLIELASLIELNQTDKAPAIDSAAFPQTPEGYFVSATPLMNELPTIGAVNFFYGSVQHMPTGPSEWSASVRCVRAPSAAALTDHYEIRGSEVLDRYTGLRWTRDAAPGKYDWMHAVEYCQGLGQGWRLPAQKELLTLVDPNVPSPLIDQSAFPAPARDDARFWTMTANLEDSLAAWVDFWQGWSVGGNGGSEYGVRCVR